MKTSAFQTGLVTDILFFDPVASEECGNLGMAGVKSLLAICSAIGVALLGWALYFILGPTVDNWFQIGTSRDLEVLRRYPVGNVPVASLVAAKYSIRSWRAYHEDWIFATRVDCSATEPSGKPLVLSWEVRHGNPPRDWIPKRDLYITPLSRAAAELTPTLLPAGVSPTDLPLSRYGAGVVYDIARERRGGS
jgi:hypothetical protein